MKQKNVFTIQPLKIYWEGAMNRDTLLAHIFPFDKGFTGARLSSGLHPCGGGGVAYNILILLKIIIHSG